MSIFKDFKEDVSGYRLRYQIIQTVSPKAWLQLHRWRKQRSDRGWSDRDTWGAGEHIARMTAEMLQHLNDNTYVDWPQWFKLNAEEEGKGTYKSLQKVIDDITQYLDITEQSWADGLYTERDPNDWLRHTWHYEINGRKLNEAEITARIHSWTKKSNASYNKAKKAMSFFARHFAGFWD